MKKKWKKESKTRGKRGILIGNLNEIWYFPGEYVPVLLTCCRRSGDHQTATVNHGNQRRLNWEFGRLLLNRMDFVRSAKYENIPVQHTLPCRLIPHSGRMELTSAHMKRSEEQVSLGILSFCWHKYVCMNVCLYTFIKNIDWHQPVPFAVHWQRAAIIWVRRAGGRGSGGKPCRNLELLCCQ